MSFLLNSRNLCLSRFSTSATPHSSFSFAPTPILRKIENPQLHRQYRKKWKFFSRKLLLHFTIDFSRALMFVSVKCKKLNKYYTRYRFLRWLRRFKWAEMARKVLFDDYIAKLKKAKNGMKAKPIIVSPEKIEPSHIVEYSKSEILESINAQKWKTMSKLLKTSDNRQRLYKERDALLSKRRAKQLAKWRNMSAMMRRKLIEDMQKEFEEKRKLREEEEEEEIEYIIDYEPEIGFNKKISDLNILYFVYFYKVFFTPKSNEIQNIFKDFEDFAHCILNDENRLDLTISNSLAYFESSPQFKLPDVKTDVDIPLSLNEISRNSIDAFEILKDGDIQPSHLVTHDNESSDYDLPLLLSSIPKVNASSLSIFSLPLKIKQQPSNQQVKVPLGFDELCNRNKKSTLYNFKHYMKKKSNSVPTSKLSEDVPLSFKHLNSPINPKYNLHIPDFFLVNIPQPSRFTSNNPNDVRVIISFRNPFRNSAHKDKSQNYDSRTLQVTDYIPDFYLFFFQPFLNCDPIFYYKRNEAEKEEYNIDDIYDGNSSFSVGFNDIIGNHAPSLDDYTKKEVPPSPEEYSEYEEEEYSEEFDIDDIDFNDFCYLYLDVPFDITESISRNASKLDSTEFITESKENEEAEIDDVSSCIRSKLSYDEMFDIDDFDSVFNTLNLLDNFSNPLNMNGSKVILEASKRMMAKTRYIPYIFQSPSKSLRALDFSFASDFAMSSIFPNINKLFRRRHRILPKNRYSPYLFNISSHIIDNLSRYSKVSLPAKPDYRFLFRRMTPKVRFIPRILRDIKYAIKPINIFIYKTRMARIESPFQNMKSKSFLPKSRFSPSLLKTTENSISNLINYTIKSSSSSTHNTEKKRRKHVRKVPKARPENNKSTSNLLITSINEKSKPATLSISQEKAVQRVKRRSSSSSDKSNKLKSSSRKSSSHRDRRTPKVKKEISQIEYKLPDFAKKQIVDAFTGTINSLALLHLEKIKFPRKHAPRIRKRVNHSFIQENLSQNSIISPVFLETRKPRRHSEKKRVRHHRSQTMSSEGIDFIDAALNNRKRKSKRSHISDYM